MECVDCLLLKQSILNAYEVKTINHRQQFQALLSTKFTTFQDWLLKDLGR